ncbi:unnamed protein product [Dicrocoelium dendriticum]|nr:unnamed protein product [Dicrocoelium dendriticum]
MLFAWVKICIALVLARSNMAFSMSAYEEVEPWEYSTFDETDRDYPQQSLLTHKRAPAPGMWRTAKR